MGYAYRSLARTARHPCYRTRRSRRYPRHTTLRLEPSQGLEGQHGREVGGSKGGSVSGGMTGSLHPLPPSSSNSSSTSTTSSIRQPLYSGGAAGGAGYGRPPARTHTQAIATSSSRLTSRLLHAYDQHHKPLPVVTVCGYAGCSRLVANRQAARCETHRREDNYQRRRRGLQHGLASAHWRGVRQAVLDRDGWRCQRCGARASSVHLDPQLHGDHYHATIDNCVTLCRSCHGTTDAPRAHETKRRRGGTIPIEGTSGGSRTPRHLSARDSS
jgi:5-methylcytosine-specific restriction endonuclease McrA